jgi:nitrite reductase (NADH) small subunit
MARIKLALTSEIPECGMVERVQSGRSILLAKVDGRIYAMDNICSHMGASLHEGQLGAAGPCLVTCPWHEAHFDLRSGRVAQETNWATDNQVFPVSIEGDEVWIEL